MSSPALMLVAPVAAAPRVEQRLTRPPGAHDEADLAPRPTARPSATPPTQAPSAPPPTAPKPTALVLGGGIAGIAAAVGLAERGVRVTLVEREAQLGGRVRAWPVEQADGSTRP